MRQGTTNTQSFTVLPTTASRVQVELYQGVGEGQGPNRNNESKKQYTRNKNFNVFNGGTSPRGEGLRPRGGEAKVFDQREGKEGIRIESVRKTKNKDSVSSPRAPASKGAVRHVRRGQTRPTQSRPRKRASRPRDTDKDDRHTTLVP